MEVKIKVIGPGIDFEILGESLVDCIETAYRQFRGRQVELFALKPLGYIDGQDLVVDQQYLDRGTIQDIIAASE